MKVFVSVSICKIRGIIATDAYHFIFAHLVALFKNGLLSLHLLHVSSLIRVHFDAAGSGWHRGMGTENLILLGLGIGGHVRSVGVELEVVGARLGDGMLLMLRRRLLLCAPRRRCISSIVWYMCVEGVVQVLDIEFLSELAELAVGFILLGLAKIEVKIYVLKVE